MGTTKGRSVLEFSGSASQVQEAFHTAIRRSVVNGEQHWANASDPSIPTALTPAVAGVLTLHNFLKKPALRLAKEPARAKIVPGKKPQVTFPAQNGQPVTYALAPQDFAVIYDANPSYTLGISGGGITIGVVGRSNLYSGAPNNTPGEDVQSFQQDAFAMCCSVFTPGNIVINGPDPGDLGGGERSGSHSRFNLVGCGCAECDGELPRESWKLSTSILACSTPGPPHSIPSRSTSRWWASNSKCGNRPS